MRRRTTTTAAQQQRRIAIAVDLSNESAFAVQWAVDNYLRPGDSVVLLHVSRTPVLYGADWGSVDILETTDAENNKNTTAAAATTPTTKRKEEALKKELDASTAAKVKEMGAPLARANIPFKVHIVKDHDMKERLCLEMERLAPSAAIMGSRGIGASSSSSTSRTPTNNGSGQGVGGGGLGSVSDYCVRHCVCPVVVVRCPDEKAEEGKAEPIVEMHSGSDLASDSDDFHASDDQQQEDEQPKQQQLQEEEGVDACGI